MCSGRCQLLLHRRWWLSFAFELELEEELELQQVAELQGGEIERVQVVGELGLATKRELGF
jgi:hypothetical protein